MRKIKLILKNHFFKNLMIGFSQLQKENYLKNRKKIGKSLRKELLLKLLNRMNQRLKPTSTNFKKQFFNKIKEIIQNEDEQKIVKFCVFKMLILKQQLVLRKFWEIYKKCSKFLLFFYFFYFFAKERGEISNNSKYSIKTEMELYENQNFSLRIYVLKICLNLSIFL